MTVNWSVATTQIDAVFADSDTRTVLDKDGTGVLWSPYEEISVFSDGKGVKFTSTNSVPQSRVTFTSIDTLSRKEGRYIYGIYPYSKDDSQDDDKLILTVPAVQTAVEGSFGTGAFPAVCRSKTDVMAFRNVCGGLRFSLSQSGIIEIVFRGNGDETLTGKVKISFDSDDCPGVAEYSSSSTGDKSVILTAPDSLGFKAGVWYYISMLPASLTEGFTVEFIKRNETGIREFTNAVQVKRSVFGSVENIDSGVGFKSSEVETELFNARNRALLNAFLEEYLSVNGKEKSADGMVSAQSSDGSWSDINYQDKAKSNWSATRHMQRIVTLACAYHTTNDQKYFNSIAKALDYWATTKPTCVNWWYNEINMPKILGPAMLLIRKDLTPAMLEDVIYVMDKAKMYKTGQNLVWLSGNVLMNAVLKRDEALARKAQATMLGEIKVIAAADSLDGIQCDWSFHQHGAQLQFGNYGLSFVTDFANWFKAWKGTCLEVTGEKLEIMQNYVYNGLEWVMWKGYFDHSACGRQVTQNAQTSKYKSAASAIEKMGLELRSPTGPRYYPKSDFGVYRTNDWYASVRMHSCRTIGYEVTNNENKQGYFSADGAVLVRRGGDEYYNVSAVWNWRHIPGVTCYDDGAAVLPEKYVGNKSDCVFGTVSGDFMAVGMKLYSRNGLSARKAWFFCPEGYVCLGAEIKMSNNYQVTTAVEQCLIKGPVDSANTWIRHNGITYVPIGSTVFKVAPASHTGDWASIYPTDSSVETKDLLDIYIDHGVKPSGASYSYMVVPTGVPGETAASYIGNQVKILQNDKNVQKISLFGRTMTIDWNAKTATVE